jgi:sugar O-acyltransferase (sialic acid O-acetyltransferase NeuD family)
MKIVIIGAGGQGRVVLDILRNNHQFKITGFLDADPQKHNQLMDGVPILGDISLISRFEELGIQGAVVAIGDNRTRNGYAEAVEKAGVGLVSAIHPSANIAGNAKIGKNVVIASGANICAHCVIEDSVIINTGSIVDHESVIQNGAHICPGVRLAGHVKVENLAFIGIGSTVIQNLTIGESAVIGAGSVVIHDIPSYSTAVGVPARVIKGTHISSQVTRNKEHTEPALPLITRPIRRRLHKPVPLEIH